MSTHARTLLRVGIVQSGTVIEERLFEPDQRVTIGQKLGNDLVVASGKLPKRWVLFESRNAHTYVRVPADATLRFGRNGTLLDLPACRQRGLVRASRGADAIELSVRSRGLLRVGDISVLFQLVRRPAVGTAPRLPSHLRGGPFHFASDILGLRPAVLAALIFSAVVQIALVAWMELRVPPPERSPAPFELVHEGFQIYTPQVAVAEPDESDDAGEPGEGAEPTEDTAGEPDATESTEPTEVASHDPSPPREPGPPAPVERIDIVRDSALAALYATEGDGPDLGFGVTDRTSSRSAEEVLSAQVAVGTGGDIVSSLELTTATDGDTPRRGEIPTGRSEIADVAVPERTEAAETEEVEPVVREGQIRDGGLGTLDEDAFDRMRRRRRRDVVACYSRILAADPTAGGRLDVVFTIDMGGRASDIQVEGISSSMESCVGGEVRQWRLPHPEGGSVRIQWPFILQPPE